MRDRACVQRRAQQHATEHRCGTPRGRCACGGVRRGHDLVLVIGLDEVDRREPTGAPYLQRTGKPMQGGIDRQRAQPPSPWASARCQWPPTCRGTPTCSSSMAATVDAGPMSVSSSPNAPSLSLRGRDIPMTSRAGAGRAAPARGHRSSAAAKLQWGVVDRGEAGEGQRREHETEVAQGDVVEARGGQ
jgi:hypothetical protein